MKSLLPGPPHLVLKDQVTVVRMSRPGPLWLKVIIEITSPSAHVSGHGGTGKKAQGHTVQQWQNGDQHSASDSSSVLLTPRGWRGSYINQAAISQPGCLQEITWSLGVSDRGTLIKATQAMQELRNHWQSVMTKEIIPLRLKGHCKGRSFLTGAENPEWRAGWRETWAPWEVGEDCLTIACYWMKLRRSQLARGMENTGQSSARVGWASGNK